MIFMPDLENKVRELRQLQALIEEAQAEAEVIREGLKATMTAAGADELKAGEYKVSWKVVTSSRLDTAALKRANPQLVELFTKTSTTRRFCVA